MVVGVNGYGYAGEHHARICKELGREVVVYDTNAARLQGLPPGIIAIPERSAFMDIPFEYMVDASPALHHHESTDLPPESWILEEKPIGHPAFPDLITRMYETAYSNRLQESSGVN